MIDPFESWEEIEAIVPELDTTHGVLVEFLVGCGVRPEEAFGADWTDVDLKGGIFTVQRAFAKGRLKRYAKTERARRRVRCAPGPCTRCIGSSTAAGSCSRTRRASGSTSTTSVPAGGAVSAGDGHRAPADLRPAAHVRGVETGGGGGPPSPPPGGGGGGGGGGTPPPA